MDKPAERPAPSSTDLDGWRQAIAEDYLRLFKLEAIAAAFQDLRRHSNRDDDIQNALLRYLSDSILRILRKHVGVNHPNRGEDIIFRAQHQLIEALLQPDTADGKGLRAAFASRVMFRMKDALAAELRERRTPAYTPLPRDKKPDGPQSPADETADDEGDEGFLNLEACSDEIEGIESSDYDLAPRAIKTSSTIDVSRPICEQIDVDRILGRVRGYRKRLAFQLFLENIPFKSKRPDVLTIANATGVSEKTARTWIKEVIQLLRNDEEVLKLRKQRVGERA